MPKEVNPAKKPAPKKLIKEPAKTGFALPKIGRDIVLFTCGLVGVFYETVFTQTDRPTLLFVFGAMIGLPAFLRTDESRKGK